MSSFIVENKTINRIVNFCFWEHDGYLKHEIERELKEIGIILHGFNDDKDTDNALKKFGEELLKLNITAFYVRYEKSQFDVKKEIEEALIGYKYEDTPLKDRGIFQVLKSIKCFLYQCSEGDIPEKSNLYKCLRNIEGNIEKHIIGEIPEFNNAEWG